ncbi:MAG: hypothetical protein K0S34_92 [Bacillales bacterium]|nr:hypothetical protein [Bacillales bacterium]
MNEKSKERIQKLNRLLVESLETTFGVNVYQDQVSEDEEANYHYFIFETGGFVPTQTDYTLNQEVLVRYYSENRDDLDERTLDIISVLKNAGYSFLRSQKSSIQKGETDSYVDEIELYFNRALKYGY